MTLAGHSHRQSHDKGHVHQAGFYSTDADFRRLIVPFVEEGVAAGHPVVIGYDERKSELLRGWLGDAAGVTFVRETSLYATPARAIETYRRMFEHHVAKGARQVRIAGDVPHAGNGGCFDGWDRYEGAVNSVWDEFPVQSLCLYDATTVADDVRDVVERTHPRLVQGSGETVTNDRYAGPSSFPRLDAVADAIEASEPTVALHLPLPGEARRALEVLDGGLLDPRILGDLRLGLAEVVTNAMIHGQPPYDVRMWRTSDRIVVSVRDSGAGPSDPLVGLIRAESTLGAGVGLWLTHQLELDVAMSTTSKGFTVRLRAPRSP